MKLPSEEDIYVCDCISSESLLNPNSEEYKKFVEIEEIKLFHKWKKKMRRKKGRKAKAREKERLKQKEDNNNIIKEFKRFDIKLSNNKIISSEITENKSQLNNNEILLEKQVSYPEEKPEQIKFIYSKMKHQIEPEFRKYIDKRVMEMIKNDSSISIDCGPRCLNRMICTECEVKSCPVGTLCRNRRFQKQENKLVYPMPTDIKGWGLFALNNIQKGDFIIQYLGEIFSLTSQIGIIRRTEYSGSTCTYLMKLSPKEVIDPTKKGNVARFINHSCDPNCVTQKWNVMGEVFVGIFAKKDIKKDEELSFDYKFDVYKTPFLECFCNAYNCKGYLGLAGGNPNLKLHTFKPKLSPVKLSLGKSNKKDNNNNNKQNNNCIELMSNKKSKKKSTFIIKKSQNREILQGKDIDSDLELEIKPKKKELLFNDNINLEEYEKPFKNLRESTRAKKEKLFKEISKQEITEEVEDSNINEKDLCEICKKSIYCDSESEHIETDKHEEMENKLNNESIPCTFCPANYHIKCLDSSICSKCGNNFVTEGINQLSLVAGNILKKTSKRTSNTNINKNNKNNNNNNIQNSIEKNESINTKLDIDKSIDSDNLDWISQSNIDKSGKKEHKESFDSRIRKNSENLSICFPNSKSDFRTKKKQQFKMITDQIIKIFDKDFENSNFKKKYFDIKNKLKPLCSPDSEPSSDFSNFLISPVELAVFKQRGTRIFLKHTKIHVFWNNSDISYRNFFTSKSELRCGCRPEEKIFVSDLLLYIRLCVLSYKETSGTVDNSFDIPAIFLKRVLGEYYRNSKFVEKEFGVKLWFERMHVTDECYPIHFMTTVKLRGKSQNIKKAHTHIMTQLRPLVARRKYMTREDIKIIISKLQQIKRNINPTEIRCCRDNA